MRSNSFGQRKCNQGLGTRQLGLTGHGDKNLELACHGFPQIWPCVAGTAAFRQCGCFCEDAKTVLKLENVAKTSFPVCSLYRK